MLEDHPFGLFPNYEELLGGVSGIKVLRVNLRFTKWNGAKAENSFGRKPIIDYGGKPEFAEIAIKNVATEGGWSARWIQTYGSGKNGPFFFSIWIDGPLKEQIPDPIESGHHQLLLKKISSLNGNSYKGCWDTLCWCNQKTLFIELKRHNKDRIRDTQIKWLEASLKAGLDLDNFPIAEWDFR